MPALTIRRSIRCSPPAPADAFGAVALVEVAGHRLQALPGPPPVPAARESPSQVAGRRHTCALQVQEGIRQSQADAARGADDQNVVHEVLRAIKRQIPKRVRCGNRRGDWPRRPSTLLHGAAAQAGEVQVEQAVVELRLRTALPRRCVLDAGAVPG